MIYACTPFHLRLPIVTRVQMMLDPPIRIPSLLPMSIQFILSRGLHCPNQMGRPLPYPLIQQSL